jgi:hypothetical protein
MFSRRRSVFLKVALKDFTTGYIQMECPEEDEPPIDDPNYLRANYTFLLRSFIFPRAG